MPDADETTVKIHSYSDGAEQVAPRDNLTPEQHNALELVKKSAQLEEVKKQSLEYLKTIDQLRASLEREQAKTAEMAKEMKVMEVRVKGIPELEAQAGKAAKLEARLRELAGALDKISAIAAAGRAE